MILDSNPFSMCLKMRRVGYDDHEKSGLNVWLAKRANGLIVPVVVRTMCSLAIPVIARNLVGARSSIVYCRMWIG
jgi:hypothetical protein